MTITMIGRRLEKLEKTMDEKRNMARKRQDQRDDPTYNERNAIVEVSQIPTKWSSGDHDRGDGWGGKRYRKSGAMISWAIKNHNPLPGR